MSRQRIEVSDSAAADISDILELLQATRGLEHAVRINDALDQAMLSLEQSASRGRVVPELRARGVLAFRETMVLPYRVIYRVGKDEVRVVAVVDHRRDLDGLLYSRARREGG